jgi:hypothetical protein
MTGRFPARGLVREFWDLAPDADVSKIYRFPGKPGESKNLVWKTLLPHWGHNSPVVANDRVFLLCEEGWKSDAPLLVCVDANSGKILWQQAVDHLDAWPEAKAKVGRECRAKELKRWRDHMTWWNRFYWDNEKHAACVQNRTEEEWNRLLAEAKKAGWEFPSFADCGNEALRGRFGLGVYKGRAGGPTDPELVKNYERCVREHYYIYPGWTSEGPFYGSTFGSVVSDGESVYAVTAQEGAACFDLAGRRKWIVDLASGTLPNTSAGVPIAAHHRMASPVLADGLLLYFHFEDARMYALDARTGQVCWKTDMPERTEIRRGTQHRYSSRGYCGHMGPGGSPIVMTLDGVTVAVTAHGAVVRVRDGKLLGQLKVEGKRRDTPNDVLSQGGQPRDYGASYTAWVPWKDIVFASRMGHYTTWAIRLKVEGDELQQTLLWCSAKTDGKDDTGYPQVVWQDRLYTTGGQELEPLTGKVLNRGSPRVCGYTQGNTHSLACGDGKLVFATQLQSPHAGPNEVIRFAIVGIPGLKTLGVGAICEPAPVGEVRERHIAFLGYRLFFGYATPTVWGNRIFIRSNDYLYCFGDPGQPFQGGGETP